MKACILSVSGPVLTTEEAALFRDQQPWAVILMGRSCVSRSQVTKLVDDIWGALGRACLIFIDQEGGRVARLKAPEWPIFPPARHYGLLFAQDEDAGLEACRIGHSLMGDELAQMGIHADCSPVVDIPVPGAHDIIGDRAFALEPVAVSRLAAAALEGLSDAGVSGVIKHMPGHGRSRSDSHEELPVVEAGNNELQKDFAAFQMVNYAPMAMSAHILYPAFDANAPATLSGTIISDVIRNRIGFDGLLMTDDLGMKALGGPLSDRGRRALDAGCDVLLHCSGFVKDPAIVLQEMTEVVNAADELSGKSLSRARRAEAASTKAKAFDRDDMRARFDELMVRVEALV